MAEQVPAKGSNEYVDYVIALASGPSLREGIINEPRIFYDVIAPNVDGLVTSGTPGAFINGEDFPIRVTHMTAACGYLDQAGDLDDFRNIQRIGLQLQYHDQFYMNPTLLPCPVWGNKVVAASDIISTGLSSWDFVATARPFVLSSRDTLAVQLLLAEEGDSGTPVTVTFTGFGMLSKRPYMLSSQLVLDQAGIALPMTTNDFRNDGLEPITITDMTVNVGGDIAAADPSGVINRISINVRQVGNGTQARWFSGPVTPAYCPASLLGLTTGRAVVHEFPGDGLIWQPNEGITVFCQALGSADFASILNLGLCGYLMVT